MILVGIRTWSLANLRWPWGRKARMAKDQREAVRYAWLELGSPRVQLPVVVRLTRIAPHKLDDDNLQGALKHVRDEIAECLRVDDRDDRVEWRYAQQTAGVREYAVKVEIDAKVDEEIAA